MSIVERLESQREELVAAMRSVAALPAGVPEEQTVQFVRGYVDIIIATAKGDLGPRSTYLNAVIPGVKAAGMPLSLIISSLSSCDVALAAVAGREHLPWVGSFCAAYSAELVQIWERS